MPSPFYGDDESACAECECDEGWIAGAGEEAVACPCPHHEVWTADDEADRRNQIEKDDAAEGD